jgi:hypothetical protein
VLVVEFVLNDISSTPAEDIEDVQQLLRLSIPVKVNNASVTYTVHDSHDDRIIDITSIGSLDSLISMSKDGSSSPHGHNQLYVVDLSAFNAQSSLSGHVIRQHGRVLNAAMAECACFIDVGAVSQGSFVWPE